jgi:hypothetical protein
VVQNSHPSRARRKDLPILILLLVLLVGLFLLTIALKIFGLLFGIAIGLAALIIHLLPLTAIAIIVLLVIIWMKRR